MRLLQFSGILSSENPQKHNLSFWNDLIREYFTPSAIMRLTLWKDNQRIEAKPFGEYFYRFLLSRYLFMRDSRFCCRNRRPNLAKIFFGYNPIWCQIHDIISRLCKREDISNGSYGH